MKHVKMLGLAAMAAMALMAFGAGTASASSSHLYSTGVPVEAGRLFHTTVQNGTTATLSSTDGGSLVDFCNLSTVASSVEYPFTGDAGGSISSLIWGECALTTDTLANGRIDINSSGTVVGKGMVITVNFSGVSCRYGTGSAPGPGSHLGALTTGKLAINAVINEQEPKQFLCPDTIKWVANYTVTSPHDLTAGA